MKGSWAWVARCPPETECGVVVEGMGNGDVFFCCLKKNESKAWRGEVERGWAGNGRPGEGKTGQKEMKAKPPYANRNVVGTQTQIGGKLRSKEDWTGKWPFCLFEWPFLLFWTAPSHIVMCRIPRVIHGSSLLSDSDSNG